MCLGLAVVYCLSSAAVDWLLQDGKQRTVESKISALLKAVPYVYLSTGIGFSF